MVKMTEGYQVSMGAHYVALASTSNFIEQVSLALNSEEEGPRSIKEQNRTRAFIACLTRRARQREKKEFDVSKCSVFYMDDKKSYLEIGLVQGLKALGGALGIYFGIAEDRNMRVVVMGPPEACVLELQEDISYHGSRCWRLVKQLSTAPDVIRDFKLFSEMMETLG